MTWRGVGILGAACVLGVSVLGWPATASALNPPTVHDGALGAAQALSGRPAPMEPTEQRTVCSEPKLAGAAPVEPPMAQHVLNLPTAWQFSRGAGQKVAVIDTGVTRHPRLPALQPGGDYVSDSDGTFDCDGHGTFVAGIIAAQPSPADAFTGVAPEAEILSIRQLSLAFEPKDRRAQADPGAIVDSGYGNVLTLAGAVVRAVDLGATVINISEVACTAAYANPADDALGAAVKYAYERNVVVVAAAGNVASQGACATQNEKSGWDSVSTVASPAWFTPYVLAVGSIDASGAPSALSLNGPWVGVAAIGRNIVSLDSRAGGTGVVDRVQTSDGPQPIEGTSFAAPYVSGLAALVRSRYPQLTAAQVIDRIKRTAHAPGIGRDDKIGHGLIDPVSALTAYLPDQPAAEGGPAPRAIAPPFRPPAPDPLPRRVAVFGAAGCVALLVIGAAVAIPFRRERDDDLPDFDSEL
ncbi:type VII secretion-associated serine protease mycosin [Nocardia sp. NPDC050712]|uniref:type VII secretion-associated serine protease mycosin n=1 Tax=Nocardia sp. NPDC050712 TaxID=3155518 RepID=UPI0033C8CF54